MVCVHKKITLFVLLAWQNIFLSPSEIRASSYSSYASATPNSIDRRLKQLAQNNPDLLSYFEMGKSTQGHTIGMLIFTKAKTPAPTVYINALHHGDEVVSLDASMAFIDFLIEHKQDSRVQKILETSLIYIQPIVNPDGFVLGRRDDGTGIDPNRDYAYPWRSDEESFQSYSSKIVRDFLELVPVKYALTLHAGTEAVFFPWCYSGLRTSHHENFRNMAYRVAAAMGIGNAVQSYFDYQSRGEFSDYVYMKYFTQVLTLEVGENLQPQNALRDYYINRTMQGILSFLDGIQDEQTNKLSMPQRPLPVDWLLTNLQDRFRIPAQATHTDTWILH